MSGFSSRPLSVYLHMVDTRQDYLRTVDNLTVTPSIDRSPNHTGKRDLITNVNFTTTGYDDSTHTPAGERALLSPQAAGAMGVEEEMTARTDRYQPCDITYTWYRDCGGEEEWFDKCHWLKGGSDTCGENWELSLLQTLLVVVHTTTLLVQRWTTFSVLPQGQVTTLLHQLLSELRRDKPRSLYKRWL